VSTLERFEFAWAPEYERAARLFGIVPEKTWVALGDGGLDARFGRWRLQTPVSNITDVSVTGPYRFLKTAGPPRLGITDLSLTFASNGQRGALITFRENVHGVERIGLIRHPELTVTVAEIDRFVSALRARAGLAP